MRRLVPVALTVALASCRTSLPGGDAFAREPCILPTYIRSVLASDLPIVEDGTLSGRVVDVAMNPVPGAQVTLDLQKLSVLADSSGRFHFVGLPRGWYRVSVRQLGYLEVADSVGVTDAGGQMLAVLVRRGVDNWACAWDATR